MNLVFVNRELQPDSADFDRSFVFVGPSLRVPDASAKESFEWGGGSSGSLVYLSLGTLFNQNLDFYRRCLAAFRHSRHRLLMSVGAATAIPDLGEIPRNVIVRNHVNQVHVLSEADVFITHGGMNSVSEALFHGVKMVVLPQAVDQFATARRLAELGLARTCKQKDLNTSLLSMIDSMLDDKALESRLREASAMIKKHCSLTDTGVILHEFLERT